MTEWQTADEAWREVGSQFQVLGETLAEALRTAWESDEIRSPGHTRLGTKRVGNGGRRMLWIEDEGQVWSAGCY